MLKDFKVYICQFDAAFSYYFPLKKVIRSVYDYDLALTSNFRFKIF